MKHIMNKIIVLTLLFVIQLNHCNSQSIYLKASGGFNIPANTQQSPEYFSFRLYFPNDVMYKVNLSNSGFSIAEGINFHGAVGYNLNKLLSLELGICYSANTKKEFEASPKLEYALNGKTNWDYKSYSLIPSILIGQSFNNSAISINIFSGIGFSNLKVKASIEDYYNNYSFDKAISFSYGYGIEYLYRLTAKIQIYISAGLNNMFYTPRHAELVSSSDPLNISTVYQREIDYVTEIKDLRLGNYYGDQQYLENPEVRLQETLKLNCIYSGIGIKYTLLKNEKK